MLDLMSKRYYYFLFSLLIIIPGIIIIATWGLPLSNEFKGGSALEAQFASGKSPQPAEVDKLLGTLGVTDVQTITSGADVLIIRSSQMNEDILPKALAAMSAKFNDKVTARSFDSVGPQLAQEVTQRGILTVIISSIALALYISVVFRGIPHAYRYGICTVSALLHDLLVCLSVEAIGARFLGWQVDTMFLTAVLTVLAFSAQDTIVVFDRIRENSGIYRRLGFDKLVNHSVVQTLTRSINTQIMAVDFMLLSLALFGGFTLQRFCIILLVGMFSGSYSSDFNAAPLLVVWENEEWKTWFKRKPKASPAA